MQSATSDVNGAIIEYRRMLVYAIDRRNLANAEIALMALNGVLPEVLKLRFDSAEYAKQESDVYLIACPKCKTEVRVEPDAVRTRLTSGGMGQWNLTDPGLVSTERYMACTAVGSGKKPCGESIIVKDEDMVVMPAMDAALDAGAPADSGGQAAVTFAPERPDISGLNDQLLREDEYWTWVRIVTALLENQLREFRHSVSADQDVELVAT